MAAKEKKNESKTKVLQHALPFENKFEEREIKEFFVGPTTQLKKEEKIINNKPQPDNDKGRTYTTSHTRNQPLNQILFHIIIHIIHTT